MRHRLIRALAAALTVTAMAIAVGCGDNTAKQQFIAHADGLCRHMNQQLRHASRPVSGVDTQTMLARFTRERQAARHAFYRAFLALDAPDGDARALQRQFRSVADIETRLDVRVGERDLTAQQAQRLAELPQAARLERAARALTSGLQAYGLSCPARMRW